MITIETGLLLVLILLLLLFIYVTADPVLVHTIAPLTISLRLVNCLVAALAMLSAVSPVAFVAAAIRPEELSVTHFLVVRVLTDIAAPISPSELALALHTVGDPLTLIATAIGPDVDTTTMQVVVEVLADVSAAVVPREAANAVLAAHDEVALILATVGPDLDTEAMLSVLVPLTNILGAIKVLKGAAALRHIVHPFTGIALTSSVDQSSVPIHLVRLPGSFVLRAISPDLHATSFPLTVRIPLARVDAAIVKLQRALS